MDTRASETERMFQAGRAAWEEVDLQEAERLLRAAFALSPENVMVGAALGAALLKSGNITEGYPLFDGWRKARSTAAPALPIPRWRGEPVDGRRILIWSEDGFGDQIMWARYARALCEAGADVAWLCPDTLVPLLADIGCTVLPATQSVQLNGFDYYCPSSALPMGFDLSFEQLSGAPYLKAPPADRRGARIGVMTNANPKNLPGGARSLLPPEGVRLRAIPDSISLDPDNTGAKTFHDTAAIMAGLDLVITVDTSVAHLAGALGVPVWILVPYVGDWRWFNGRDDSPWYDSARLLRQGPDREWGPVLDRVMDELSAHEPGAVGVA